MSKISKKVETEVRKILKNRCNYCLTPQNLTSYKLEIEHIYPISKGGSSEKENLCLACRHCNQYKSSKIYGFDAVSQKRTRLFNPNQQNWSKHFIWSDDQTMIIGKTSCGRATILALKINDELQITARKIWKMTGFFPPKD